MSTEPMKDLSSAMNNVLNKTITCSFKEREFMLLGNLVAKASLEFMTEFEKRAEEQKLRAGEPENNTPENQMLYEFYRDSALMLEALVPKFQKTMDEQGSVPYSFSDFTQYLKGEPTK